MAHQPSSARVSAPRDPVVVAGGSVAVRKTPTWRDRLAAINELTKPRITRLVTITSGVGFVLSALAPTRFAGEFAPAQAPWTLGALVLSAVGCVIGTACSASGANALNQWMERHRDGLMPRTCERPLPTRKVSERAALTAGIGFCIAGVSVLLLACGPAASLVSLATILIYLLAYTPLKPVTTISTLIGAIPGALPPLIGWCAAGVGVSLWDPPANWFIPLAQAGGWALFLLMFVWQIPHSLALAWMYKDDYAKGGYRLLPLLDPSGHRTAGAVFLWTVVLLPATLSPALAMSSMLGYAYPITAIVTGVAAIMLAWNFLHDRSRDRAKRVFLGSIMQLPLLLLVMVIDALAIAVLR
ncbi:MAG: heme o synthase [Phycisphaerales bacterium]